MSFFVQGGVEDEQPFTGTCPTCGQTDLRAENERLRAFAQYVSDMGPTNPAPLFEKARAALEPEPVPPQDSGTDRIVVAWRVKAGDGWTYYGADDFARAQCESYRTGENGRVEPLFKVPVQPQDSGT